MEFKYIIKLPALSKFRSCSKIVDPYTKFYKWLIDELYPNIDLYYDRDKAGFPIIPGKTYDVCAVYLTIKDANRLHEMVEDWFMNQGYRKPSAGWLYLQYSPCEIRKDKHMYKSGYAYVLKDFLRKREKYE